MKTKNTIRNTAGVRTTAEQAGLPLNGVPTYVYPEINRSKYEAARSADFSKVRPSVAMVALCVGPNGTLGANVTTTPKRDVIAVGNKMMPADLFPVELLTREELVRRALEANRPAQVYHRATKTSIRGMLLGSPKKAYQLLVHDGGRGLKEVKTTADAHNSKEIVSFEGLSDRDAKAIVAEFRTGKPAKRTVRIKAKAAR